MAETGKTYFKSPIARWRARLKFNGVAMLNDLVTGLILHVGLLIFKTASMAEWLRAWDTLAMMKLWRREVVSSIPDRGTIVG